MSLEADLWATARAVRAFLEPVWPEWHRAWGGDRPDVPSRWTCGRTSLFLQQVLADDTGLEATWASGTPRHGPDQPEIGPFGFFTGDRWESHAWVEVERTWIVDLTADQFGAAPIIVTTIADPRYGKGDGDTALPEFREARARAVAILRPRWQTWDLSRGARLE
jgi:hypothetical protein